jgi:gelsolin
MSGLVKAKEYKVDDSNIAGLGSDADKKARVAAASTEDAWKGAGKSVGIQIWRIEKFLVKPWPKDQYGSFYDGDAYIVLKTWKKPEVEKLFWDIFFWLGKNSSQDEQGVAAYKTVELDDLLGTEPTQHREVQGEEGTEFLAAFNNKINLLSGGIESGFKHVEPAKYVPRLLWVKGKRLIRVTQVELSHKSLNSGDVFVLDCGLQIFQFNGKSAGPMEKQKGAQITRALKDERKSQPQVVVVEEEDKGVDADTFWSKVGGKSTIKTAEEGGADDEAHKENAKIRRLFQLSDASGKMTFKLIAEGNAVKRSQLITDDVMIFDSGSEVFAWVGKGSNKEERRKALGFAQDYLKNYNRPNSLPICRVLEGGENQAFNAAMG